LSPEVGTDLRELRRIALKDFYVFAKGICGFSWLVPEIHLPLCRMLEKNPKRALFVLPRGWLKTTLCSIAYPLWRATQDTNFRTLIVQNTYTNAIAKLRVIRDIVERNELYRTLFPEVLPTTKSVWRDDSLCLNRSRALDASTFEAAGTRTQVVSRHYDLIVEDDTVAPELDDLGEMGVCPHQDDVDRAIGWHRLVSPLLVSPAESQNLVVGTRWFLEDLISWIKKNETSQDGRRGFKVYERACLEKNGLPDERGTPTYEKRFPRSVLEELKAALGPYLFSCLYLNMPIPMDDMIFRPEWITYYDLEPRELYCFTTVDPAGDPELSKGDPDYNVVLTTGQHPQTGQIFLLEYTRKKCSPSELIDDIFAQVERWHPIKVGVESVQYQSTLQFWVRERMQKTGRFFIVEAITHGRKSKNARILGLQPLVANKQLVFRKSMVALVNELLVFPYGKNDDLIDALSMQLPLWRVTSAIMERDRSEEFGRDTYGSILKEMTSRQAGIGLYDEVLSHRLVGMFN